MFLLVLSILFKAVYIEMGSGDLISFSLFSVLLLFVKVRTTGALHLSLYSTHMPPNSLAVAVLSQIDENFVDQKHPHFKYCEYPFLAKNIKMISKCKLKMCRSALLF